MAKNDKQAHAPETNKKEVALSSEASDFIFDQPIAVIQGFRALKDKLAASGRLTMPDARKIEGEKNLFELRLRVAPNIYRFFYCYDAGSFIIVLNGFVKKTQKTPLNEIRKAKAIMRRYGL